MNKWVFNWTYETILFENDIAEISKKLYCLLKLNSKLAIYNSSNEKYNYLERFLLLLFLL
ncbi:hypothetical protein DHB64_08335 [Antarcticibacterium sp. W02-3]|nr:hypothetical protein [Antarcticibacterium sp. W02-3]